MNEVFFKAWLKLRNQNMVDNSVLEWGGKNFPFYRFVHDKAVAASGVPCFCLQFPIKLHKIVFKINFKSKCTKRIAYIFATLKIEFKKIFKELFGIKIHYGKKEKIYFYIYLFNMIPQISFK